jgi:uncharacterized protein
MTISGASIGTSRAIPFEQEETPETVKETLNVLEMWSSLERAYAKLSPADKARVEKEAFGKDVKFRGFDGNNEGDHTRG